MAKSYILNRLSQTQSPYLLQHADNPVHWQPWDATALAQAKQQNKPILLSIGYAACHWCHVMEDESFVDDATAALMNQSFINIKVDREERPDLDRIYQSAHYIFTRHSGGWPLTMFLTPDGEPFFGGTYFPKQARQGMPSFSHVLQQVNKAWETQQEAILLQNAEVLRLLRKLDETPAEGDEPNAAILATVAEQFIPLFDQNNGGLGGAPKFPHPVELSFCLSAATIENNDSLLAAVKLSLSQIASRGLFDHLGGGFFRYCVDEKWQTPHFEKMLYDNGLLLSLFADAQIAFSSASFRLIVEQTIHWALQEMRADNGCFYSSLDADSAGGEGAFYIWDKETLAAQLSDEEYNAVAHHYGLSDPPTVEGKWHLSRQHTVEQTAAELHHSGEKCQSLLASAEQKLMLCRQERPRPKTDDKILTAWNALFINGLARAGRLCGRADWVLAASTAFASLNQNMRKDNRTFASRRNDVLGEQGFLDDCAFLLDAALELLRADFTANNLHIAQQLAKELCDHFEDKQQGGFFFTANDSPPLIRRPKPPDDGATPSGNGIAIRALLLLSWLSADTPLYNTAHNALCAFNQTMRQHLAGSSSLLAALQFYHKPPALVFLLGDSQTCQHWQTHLEQHYNPNLLIYRLPRQTDDLPAVLQKPQPDSGAVAYVCSGLACHEPIDNLAALQKFLADGV